MAARAACIVLLVGLLAAADGQSSSNNTITVAGYGNIQSTSDTAAVRSVHLSLGLRRDEMMGLSSCRDATTKGCSDQLGVRMSQAW